MANPKSIRLDWQLEATEGACQIPLKPLYNAKSYGAYERKASQQPQCRLPTAMHVFHSSWR